MLTTYSLSGLAVVTPDTATTGGSIQVDQKKLGRLGGKSKFDLQFGDGFAAFPALINIHDHFNGNYLPKVGPPPGEFYVNWSYWDKDLKNSDVVKRGAREDQRRGAVFPQRVQEPVLGSRHGERSLPPRMERAVHPAPADARHPQLHPLARLLLLRPEVGGRVRGGARARRRRPIFPSSLTWRRASTRKHRRESRPWRTRDAWTTTPS